MRKGFRIHGDNYRPVELISGDTGYERHRSWGPHPKARHALEEIKRISKVSRRRTALQGPSEFSPRPSFLCREPD